MVCGRLMAIRFTIGARPLTGLGPCPGCASRGWNLQSVPIGPFTAKWAHLLVNAAVALANRKPGEHPDLELAIEHAKVSTRE